MVAGRAEVEPVEAQSWLSSFAFANGGGRPGCDPSQKWGWISCFRQSLADIQISQSRQNEQFLLESCQDEPPRTPPVKRWPWNSPLVTAEDALELMLKGQVGFETCVLGTERW